MAPHLTRGRGARKRLGLPLPLSLTLSLPLTLPGGYQLDRGDDRRNDLLTE